MRITSSLTAGVLALLLVVPVLLTGCTENNQAETPGMEKQESAEGAVADTSAVVLGAVYNLTGTQSGLDIPSSRGAQLAVEQANAAGGVLGRPLELILENGETDTSVIARKTAAMIDEHPSISALLGLSDTDMLLAAAPVAARHKRLFLTSGATSPRLPAQVPEFLFLACFGDNVQAAAAAEWAFGERSARTVTILFNSRNTYARLLQGYFKARFEELGGRVEVVIGYEPQKIASVMKEVKPADVVFLAAVGPEEIADGIRLLRKQGFDGPIIGGDSYDAENLWREHPEVKDVFFTTHAYLGPDNPDPRVKAFREAYAAAYKGEAADAFAALGYDAVNLLIEAIKKAESSEPPAVEKSLADIQEFHGITGDIKYVDGNRVPVKSVTILEVRDGASRLVQQVMPESVPAP